MALTKNQEVLFLTWEEGDVDISQPYAEDIKM